MKSGKLKNCMNTVKSCNTDFGTITVSSNRPSDQFLREIETTIRYLCEIVDKHNLTENNIDIDNAVGEVSINNIEYQIQVSLTSNKKLWIKENEVSFSEVTKLNTKIYESL